MDEGPERAMGDKERQFGDHADGEDGVLRLSAGAAGDDDGEEIRDGKHDDAEHDAEHEVAATAAIDRGERDLLPADRRGVVIELTAKELAILRVFAKHPGEVISRQTFLEDVWGLPPSVETRTVDNTLAALRRKIEGSAEPRLILTVRGKGYRWGGG